MVKYNKIGIRDVNALKSNMLKKKFAHQELGTYII